MFGNMVFEEAIEFKWGHKGFTWLDWQCTEQKPFVSQEQICVRINFAFTLVISDVQISDLWNITFLLAEFSMLSVVVDPAINWLI